MSDRTSFQKRSSWCSSLATGQMKTRCAPAFANAVNFSANSSGRPIGKPSRSVSALRSQPCRRSSKAIVCPAPCCAHGTYPTTTPCFGQGDPRRVGLDIGLHRTQVERSPSTPTGRAFLYRARLAVVSYVSAIRAADLNLSDSEAATPSLSSASWCASWQASRWPACTAWMPGSATSTPAAPSGTTATRTSPTPHITGHRSTGAPSAPKGRKDP
jgi:hypothetical protein